MQGPFDLTDEDMRVETPKRESPHQLSRDPHYRSNMFIGRITLGVFFGLVVFSLVAGAIAFTVWRYNKAQERAKRAEMYQQRVVFEKWDIARMDVWSNEQSIQIYSRDKEKIEGFKKEIQAAQKRQKDLEDESQRRWGKHPSEFQGYHGTKNPYYQED